MCDQVDEEVYFTYGGSERIVTGETVVAFNLEIGADPPRARRVTVVSRHGELSTGRIAQYNPETDTGFIEIAPEFQRRIMFHSSELEETFPHPVAIGAFVAFQTRPAQGDRKSMATHVRQCGRVVKFDTKERDGLIGERICFSYQASAYREAERGRGGVASSASGPRDRARQQQQQQPQQGRGGRGGVEVLTVTPQPQSTAARESDGGGERGAVSDDPKRQVMPCRYGVDCKLYTCQFGHPDTRPKCCPSVDACDNPSCPLIHKKLMMEQGPPTMSNFLENTQGKILAIRKGVRVRACRHHPRCRAGLRCSDAHVIQEPHKRLASGGTAYRSSSNLSPRHDQQQQHSQEMVGRDTQTPAGAARGKPTALPSSQQGPGPVTASGGVAILSSVQGPRVEEGGKGRGPVIEEVGPTAGSFPPGVHSSSALSAPHPPHGERDGRDPHALPPMGPLGALMQQQGGGNTGPVIHGVRSGPSGPSGGRGIQSVSGGYGGVSPSTGGEKEKQQQQQQHQVVPVSGGMGMCGGASSRRGSWRVVVIVVDGYRWGLETGGVAEELDRLESFVLSEIGNACEDGVKTVSPRGARVFLHPDPLEVAKLQNQQKRGSGEWGDGPVTGEGGLRYIQRVKDLGWQVFNCRACLGEGGGVQSVLEERDLARIVGDLSADERYDPIGGQVQRVTATDVVLVVTHKANQPRVILDGVFPSHALQWISVTSAEPEGPSLSRWGRQTQRLLSFPFAPHPSTVAGGGTSGSGTGHVKAAGGQGGETSLSLPNGFPEILNDLFKSQHQHQQQQLQQQQQQQQHNSSGNARWGGMNVGGHEGGREMPEAVEAPRGPGDRSRHPGDHRDGMEKVGETGDGSGSKGGSYRERVCRTGEGCKIFSCPFVHPANRTPPCPESHVCENPKCHFLHRPVELEPEGTVSADTKGKKVFSNLLSDTFGRHCALSGLAPGGLKVCDSFPACPFGSDCRYAHLAERASMKVPQSMVLANGDLVPVQDFIENTGLGLALRHGRKGKICKDGPSCARADTTCIYLHIRRRGGNSRQQNPPYNRGGQRGEDDRASPASRRANESGGGHGHGNSSWGGGAPPPSTGGGVAVGGKPSGAEILALLASGGGGTGSAQGPGAGSQGGHPPAVGVDGRPATASTSAGGGSSFSFSSCVLCGARSSGGDTKGSLARCRAGHLVCDVCLSDFICRSWSPDIDRQQTSGGRVPEVPCPCSSCSSSLSRGEISRHADGRALAVVESRQKEAAHRHARQERSGAAGGGGSWRNGNGNGAEMDDVEEEEEEEERSSSQIAMGEDDRGGLDGPTQKLLDALREGSEGPRGHVTKMLSHSAAAVGAPLKASSGSASNSGHNSARGGGERDRRGHELPQEAVPVVPAILRVGSKA